MLRRAQVLVDLGITWRLLGQPAIALARARDAAQLASLRGFRLFHLDALLLLVRLEPELAERQAATVAKRLALAHHIAAQIEAGVYDDQADYFNDSSSAWLSPAERAAAAAVVAKKQAAASARSRGMQIGLDFAGRSVVLRDETADAEAATREALRALAFGDARPAGSGGEAGGSSPHPLRPGAPAPGAFGGIDEQLALMGNDLNAIDFDGDAVDGGHLGLSHARTPS
jgi:hypothetical protein